MLCKRVKHKSLKRKLIISGVILLVIIFLFEMQAIPFTRKCVQKQSKTISANIIAEKIEEIQNDLGYTYSDLAIVKYSDEGQVRSISENTVNVNKLKSKITCSIQAELDKRPVYSFNLPLGAFTNITLLNNIGPFIDINFTLTGSVNCKIKSSFKSAGVNQTIHKIRLIVITDIITMSPEYSEHNKFTSDYDIAQTVIVGEIPSTFADIVR